MYSKDQVKEKTGLIAAQLVQDGMTIGAGTGSTAFWFIEALGKRIKEGLSFKAVPTSKQTAELLTLHNIPVADLNTVERLDLVIDGADEIDHQLQVIKGGGGALLKEKMVAFAALRYIIIADSSKLVKKLGKFPLPVEVIPFGYKQVQKCIEKKYGHTVSMRRNKGLPFVTDQNNYILDIAFNQLPDHEELAIFLKTIPGLVEHGLFLDMAQEAIIGFPGGETRVLKSQTF
jgi:ribose 5-phosphate isomerase A